MVSTQLSYILSALLHKHNITESQLSRAIGLPRATINKIHTSNILDPRASTLQSIARYFNISVDQLLGNVPLAAIHNVIVVPFIAWDQLSINPLDISTDEHITIINEMSKAIDNNTFFATLHTPSTMLPSFDKNTVIVLDIAATITNNDVVAVYIKQSQSIILREILIDGGRTMLISSNQLFQPILLSCHDSIIAKVIYAKKQF